MKIKSIPVVFSEVNEFKRHNWWALRMEESLGKQGKSNRMKRLMNRFRVVKKGVKN